MTLDLTDEELFWLVRDVVTDSVKAKLKGRVPMMRWYTKATGVLE